MGKEEQSNSNFNSYTNLGILFYIISIAIIIGRLTLLGGSKPYFSVERALSSIEITIFLGFTVVACAIAGSILISAGSNRNK